MFEVELASDRRNDPSLQHYLQVIGQTELLTKSEEYELARRIRDGDKEALDKLVNANLRFVVSVAKQYRNHGLSYMDLIAEGNIGLITAARRFDERRGFRFISYAVWWIRQAIQKAIAEQTNTVRLPVNRIHQVQSYKRLATDLEQKHHRRIVDDEVADALGISSSRMRQLRAASRPLISLDQRLHDEETTLADTLQDDEGPDPEEGFIQKELQSELQASLEVLTDRERGIITRYYGLGHSDNWSLEAIGQDLNLSRERVRQIRNQALEKIREAQQGEILDDFLA
jgi:RNA polymerase primary sigma factor